MRTWLTNKWDLFRDNFLFIPLTMAISAVVACVALSYVDASVKLPTTGFLSLLRSGSAEGVRSLLTALVGSLMTALSIVFSITVVSLTLAASQLGPRLLRNFMRDRSNQVILGVFVATFLYCLMTLRLVGQANHVDELPHLTVVGGFLLACVALGVLVYFIHHVALSIQAPQVITSVSRELMGVIEDIFPAPDEELADEADLPEDVTSNYLTMTADWNGYLQAIDEQGLTRIATDHDVILKVMCRPGHFITKGEPIARVFSSQDLEEPPDFTIKQSFAWAYDRSDALTEKNVSSEAIRKTVILGSRRSATQDMEFVMMQLVEIATRALSPGINDPFTAMTCVDRLGAAVCKIAGRPMPPKARYDGEGNLRLLLDRTDFGGLLAAAFNQIRQHADGEPAVLIRLLEAFHRTAKQVGKDNQREVVWKHAQMVHRVCEKLEEPEDRQDAEQRFVAIQDELADYLEEESAS